MKKYLFCLACAATLLGCQPQQSGAENEDENEDENEIEGAWEIVDRTYTNANDSTWSSPPYRSIIMFTDKYYSIEIAQANRPSWPELGDGEQVSYEDLLNAYGYLTSNSGTYEIQGDSIIFHVQIAKYPNIMNDPLSYAQGLKLESDMMTLSVTRGNGDNVVSTHKRLD